jgi:hypothetical protein
MAGSAAGWSAFGAKARAKAEGKGAVAKGSEQAAGSRMSRRPRTIDAIRPVFSSIADGVRSERLIVGGANYLSAVRLRNGALHGCAL